MSKCVFVCLSLSLSPCLSVSLYFSVRVCVFVSVRALVYFFNMKTALACGV
jgi:hypothetical protein